MLSWMFLAGIIDSLRGSFMVLTSFANSCRSAHSLYIFSEPWGLVCQELHPKENYILINPAENKIPLGKTCSTSFARKVKCLDGHRSLYPSTLCFLLWFQNNKLDTLLHNISEIVIFPNHPRFYILIWANYQDFLHFMVRRLLWSVASLQIAKQWSPCFSSFDSTLLPCCTFFY